MLQFQRLFVKVSDPSACVLYSKHLKSVVVFMHNFTKLELLVAFKLIHVFYESKNSFYNEIKTKIEFFHKI